MNDFGRSADPRMSGFRNRTEVAAVEALLERRVTSLASETVSLSEAAGRVLATPIDSPIDFPPFDRSAMDGFALRGEDTFGASAYSPVELRIRGDAAAGHGFVGRVGSGEAVQIATGAPLPDGANAVLVVEHARILERAGESFIEATDAVPPGRHVSRRGEDVVRGAALFPSGRRLRPQDVGLLVAVGVAEVEVVRAPTVDIVPTGNELLVPGSVPHGDRIVDSNSPMLEALVRRDGGRPRLHPICRDDAESLRACLRACVGDVILVTGGTSVGREDHAPTVLADLGSLEVHGVAMRPSSPVGLGFLEERPVFLLPGNPVSCLCAYDFFSGPTIRALGGRSRAWPYPSRDLPLARKLTSQTGRVDYARVRVVADRVEPLRVSGASILSSTTEADGFVIVPQDLEGFDAGERVTVYFYG